MVDVVGLDVEGAYAEGVVVNEVAEACSWRVGRALVLLRRPTGRLLAAVAVVVDVDVEAVDPADGGRGGRRVVALVRDVAWDFVRACVLEIGDCGFAVGEFAVIAGPGREDVVGESFGAEEMDLGLMSLLVDAMGRTVFVVSAWLVASF